MIISVGAVIFIIASFVVIMVHNGQKTQSKSTSSSVLSLLNYETNTSSVSFTTYGNLVSNSQRTAAKITVTPTDVNISILSGYENTVVKTEDFPNNMAAYNAFLPSLQSNGFLTAKTTKLTESSACPSGETYELILNNNSSIVSDLWDDNCNPGVDGTFKGAGNQNVFNISTLFQNQIPNYSDFTSGYTF
jgi:hypothetical protein